METNDSIFTAQDQEQQTNVADTTQATPKQPSFNIPTEVNELVGEGKKYKSVEEALKSVPHAQTHIQKLEDEARQLREELARRKTAEELLSEIKQVQVPQQQTIGSVEADPEVLSQIVEQVLEKKTAQQQAQQNAKSVVEKFTAVYGEKAEKVYNDVAKALGMSQQELNLLAMKSPSAVLKLAGFDSKQTTQVGKIHSDVNVPTTPTNNIDSRIKLPKHPTTKDAIAALQAAREKVLSQYK